jgi:hypothetical protein
MPETLCVFRLRLRAAALIFTLWQGFVDEREFGFLRCRPHGRRGDALGSDQKEEPLGRRVFSQALSGMWDDAAEDSHAQRLGGDDVGRLDLSQLRLQG